MKVYTKKGDEGKTSLIGNERVLKSDVRVEAYGTIDELTAYLGLIKNLEIDKEHVTLINKIQNALFIASAYIACSSEEFAKKLQKPEYDIIDDMEKAIDKMDELLPKTFSFSTPANNITSAYLNIARTICRRAERKVIAVEADFPDRNFVLQLLNRLSDYLYMLYRVADI